MRVLVVAALALYAWAVFAAADGTGFPLLLTVVTALAVLGYATLVKGRTANLVIGAALALITAGAAAVTAATRDSVDAPIGTGLLLIAVPVLAILIAAIGIAVDRATRF